MVNISRNTSQVCGMMGNKADAMHQAVSRYIQMARTSESRCYASGWTQEKGPIRSVSPYIKTHIFCTQHTELVK
jgi:hypothetical protein